MALLECRCRLEPAATKTGIGGGLDACRGFRPSRRATPRPSRIHTDRFQREAQAAYVVSTLPSRVCISVLRTAGILAFRLVDTAAAYASYRRSIRIIAAG